MKKFPLIILSIGALICSRIMFTLFNDPEGPNLLVVIGMAVIVYGVSLAAYLYNTLVTGSKRLIVAFFVQILVVIVFYLFLK
jgi:drug/metabolite transporter (DMT)-like permease